MHSCFESFLIFGLTQADEIRFGATYINGLAQDCSNSSALAMELLQTCTKPSTCRLSYTVNIMPVDAQATSIQEPGHQQTWYWPNQLEYSISSIRRVNSQDQMADIQQMTRVI